MSKSKIMEEVLEVLKEYEAFLISSHINPDGDAIGSQLAFYSLLSDLGKKVSVVNSDPVPLAYSFLPNAESLRYIKSTSSKENTRHKVQDTRKTRDMRHETRDGKSQVSSLKSQVSSLDSIPDVEVAVILDCGNLNRIGEELAARIHPKHALINIDHHRSNDLFGTHNLVDTHACATAELIFDLMQYADIEIGRDRAVCLYTAILTDTGCFKYTNTTAEAHRIAARLIEEGVCPDRIAELVYGVIPYQRAKLFAMALETLRLSSDGKIAWMSVTSEMHDRTGTGSDDTEGFIDYVRSLRGIDVAILFREIENEAIKVSLRSKLRATLASPASPVHVDQIAAMFGGGGHQAAAGCVIPGPLDKAINTILDAVKCETQRHPGRSINL
jgi:phosphoesterase RecJ-like protein